MSDTVTVPRARWDALEALALAVTASASADTASAWKHGYRDALASRPATPHLALNADAYSDGYDEGVTDRDIYEG